jgi:hypothetical protein
MSPALAAGAILFDSVQAVQAESITFDDWHGNEHLEPVRRLLPQAAERRYASAPRASMTSIFELGPEPLVPSQVMTAASAPTARVLERFIAHPLSTQHGPQAGHWIEARIAYPVFFAVPAQEADEFNAWYEEEHLNMLFGCSSWLACRRFQITSAHPRGWTHLALHYLADASALRSPERDAARSTAWRDRLASRPWFKGDYRVLHRLA